MKKLHLALLIGIVLLAVFARFYTLGYTPAGLTNDEADIGYDAYSILLTGHDQWKQFLPLTSFQGFGDYRPVLYTYLVIPSIKFFGLTEFAIRFPSAVFGTLGVFFLYLLLKRLENPQAGLIAAALFAISPWAVGLSRIGIETPVAATLLLAGMYFFLLGKEKPKSYIISLILFSLTLYTYAGYLLFTPMVILSLLWYCELPFRTTHQKAKSPVRYPDGSSLKTVLKSKISPHTLAERIGFLHKKYLIAGLCIFLIFALPLLLQHNQAAKVRFSQINFLHNINSIGITNTLNDQRGACLLSFPPSICKLTNNKPLAFGTILITNYLSHFSIDFLYIRGNPSQYNILPQRGLEFLFEIFFLLAGLTWIIKAKKKEGYLLLTLLLLSPIPDSLTGAGQYSRSFAESAFLVSITALGIWSIFQTLKKHPVLQKLFAVLITVTTLGSFILFFITYLTYFSVNYAFYSADYYKGLMKYIQKAHNNYDRIYISRNYNDTKQYIYYLFYAKYNPTLYQSKKNISFSIHDGGWVSIDRVDNIYFIGSIIGLQNAPAKNTNKILLISHPLEFPKFFTSQTTFKDRKGDIHFETATLQKYLDLIQQSKDIKANAAYF